MASYSNLYQAPSRQIDTKQQKWFDDEEESSVLDDGILDGGVDSSDLFSPTKTGAGEWTDFDHDVVSANSSTNPFLRHNNPFAYDQQQVKPWESGSCTPTADYEGLPTGDVDDTTATSYMSLNRRVTAPGSISAEEGSCLGSRPVPPFSPEAGSTTASLSTSPLSNKDWGASVHRESHEARSLPRRPRPGSPLHSHSPLLRRDGIRKKNARFEIPAERNLLNIDQLIAQSADDQEIKELKQQKRLLRNRQAALDSRQRKKQHTERLEQEKKEYSSVLTELEDRVMQMELSESAHRQQENEWKATRQQLDQCVQGLLMEKEEMVRQHTLETGDLRKKNAILTEYIQSLQSQKIDSAAMSTVPSSSGFSADFSDVDGLTMEGNSWDNFSFLTDFAEEPEIKSEQTLVVPQRRVDKAAIAEEDKPAASGLLLVLLLCGAFVASQGSTSTPSIPRMSDDIRAASATVLDNIFKDAGVQHGDPRLASFNRVQALEPAPSSKSGATWPKPSKTVFTSTEANMFGFSDTSSLDVLNDQLARPTKEQEREQAFSLSANQYNGITSQDFLRRPDEPSTSSLSRGRTEFETDLRAMRNRGDKSSAAEVYTRSLLWDKVPTDVVREFARFVSDSNNARSDVGAHGNEGSA